MMAKHSKGKEVKRPKKKDGVRHKSPSPALADKAANHGPFLHLKCVACDTTNRNARLGDHCESCRTPLSLE